MVAKTIVITGGSDGIGAAAARQLSRDGHHIVIVGRSPEKSKAVADDLGADWFVADFAELTQVRTLAAALLDSYPTIDVLANNAGGILGSSQRTADGFEKTFQVNHLAPFLLTNLLMDRLVQSRAVVINTSSSAGRRAFANFDDLDAVQNQHHLVAYATAKCANMLFTAELHRRYHHIGVSTAAFHPGSVASNFSAETGSRLFALVYRTPLRGLLLATPEQGAEQLVWLASTTPGADWQSGEYYVKRQPAAMHKNALDTGLTQRFWNASRELVAPMSAD